MAEEDSAVHGFFVCVFLRCFFFTPEARLCYIAMQKGQTEKVCKRRRGSKKNAFSFPDQMGARKSAQMGGKDGGV